MQYVQSLLYHCTKQTTVVLHFISTGCWALMMFDIQHWLRTTKLQTSAGDTVMPNVDKSRHGKA